MPFLLLSLTTPFPRSGALQPSVPATEDPLPKPVGSWSPSAFCPVPSGGSSSFTLILVLTWLTLNRWSPVTAAFPTLGISYLRFPSLFPLVLWGEEASGGQASRLGVTGRCWTMCLFFNSIKKPTSVIPFLFFLDLGIQLLPVTELRVSASCSVGPGSWVTGKPQTALPSLARSLAAGKVFTP